MHISVLILFGAFLTGALSAIAGDYDPQKTRALTRFARQILICEDEIPEETDSTLRGIKELICAGADPGQGGTGKILVLYAMKYGDLDLLRQVASSPSCVVDQHDNYSVRGDSLIDRAINWKRPELAKELVLFGYNKDRALKNCAQNKCTKLVTELIGLGAYPDNNQRDSLGSANALFITNPSRYYWPIRDYTEDELETTHELFRLGAYGVIKYFANRIEAPLNSLYLENFQDLVGKRELLLSYAITGEFLGLTKLLEGIMFEGENILHGAIRYRDEEIFGHILAHLAATEEIQGLINRASSLGLTPLRLTFNTRHQALIVMLIYYGANPLEGEPSVLELADRDPELAKNSCQPIYWFREIPTVLISLNADRFAGVWLGANGTHEFLRYAAHFDRILTFYQRYWLLDKKASFRAPLPKGSSYELCIY